MKKNLLHAVCLLCLIFLFGTTVVAQSGEAVVTTLTDVCDLEKNFQFTQTYKIGQRSEGIRDLNCVLSKLLNYKSTLEDDIYRSDRFTVRTKKMLRLYQKGDKTLKVTGTFNSNTRKSLNEGISLMLSLESLYDTVKIKADELKTNFTQTNN